MAGAGEPAAPSGAASAPTTPAVPSWRGREAVRAQIADLGSQQGATQSIGAPDTAADSADTPATRRRAADPAGFSRPGDVAGAATLSPPTGEPRSAPSTSSTPEALSSAAPVIEGKSKSPGLAAADPMPTPTPQGRRRDAGKEPIGGSSPQQYPFSATGAPHTTSLIAATGSAGALSARRPAADSAGSPGHEDAAGAATVALLKGVSLSIDAPSSAARLAIPRDSARAQPSNSRTRDQSGATGAASGIEGASSTSGLAAVGSPPMPGSRRTGGGEPIAYTGSEHPVRHAASEVGASETGAFADTFNSVDAPSSTHRPAADPAASGVVVAETPAAPNISFASAPANSTTPLLKAVRRTLVALRPFR